MVPALTIIATVLNILHSLRGLKSVDLTTIMQAGLDMFSVISVGPCAWFSKELTVREERAKGENSLA